MYKGKYLDALIEFINKESPDFVSMQEVSSGILNYFEGKSANLFEIVKSRIEMDGVFHNDMEIAEQPMATLGNAIFSKWPILSSTQVFLKKSEGALTLDEFNDIQNFPEMPRSLIDATIDFNGKNIHILSAHGAWTAPPTDTEETARQATIIVDHIKTIQAPFIFGADLNMPPDSQVVKSVSQVAKNLMTGSAISQTTHPTMHKIAPKGYLIDYVFVSKEFKKNKIEAPEILVSDHLPVVAQLEFNI